MPGSEVLLTGDKMKKGQRRQRGKRAGKIIWGIVGILALTAFIVFGVFRVKEIAVTGNKNFTASEIKQAVLQDGLCQNTLYLMWKYSDKGRAETAMPFLSGIKVKMANPFKVELTVSEKKPVGYMRALGKYVYFDRMGMVIENSQKVRDNVPEVTGITLDKVELYKPLSATDTDKLSNVIKVADLLDQEALVPDEIRYSTKDELILIFGKLNVMMGDESSLEDKVVVLNSILPNVEQKSGNLYMENYSSQSQTVTYREIPETETETDEEGNVISTEKSQGEGEETHATQASGAITYQESDGTFAEDADGNRYYTDKKGNITYNVDNYNYLDANGEIITDGYGYIDPYTGAYIQ